MITANSYVLALQQASMREVLPTAAQITALVLRFREAPPRSRRERLLDDCQADLLKEVNDFNR